MYIDSFWIPFIFVVILTNIIGFTLKQRSVRRVFKKKEQDVLRTCYTHLVEFAKDADLVFKVYDTQSSMCEEMGKYLDEYYYPNYQTENGRLFIEPTPVSIVLQASVIDTYIKNHTDADEALEKFGNSDSDSDYDSDTDSDSDEDVEDKEAEPEWLQDIKKWYGGENIVVDFFVQNVLSEQFAANSRNVNPKSHSHMVLYASSQTEINQTERYLTHIMGYSPSNVGRSIYEWSKRDNCYISISKKCNSVKMEDLQGLDSYFQAVKRDVEVIATKKDMMQQLGIMGGQNYLLHGPPGTGKLLFCNFKIFFKSNNSTTLGKSSFAKSAATEFNAPIYCVKLRSVPSASISKALCPNHSGPVAIVLIEDFDRYLTGRMGSEEVSELLNALDGIYPAPNIFRFFSANFPEKVIKDAAMNTRMRRRFYFGLQTNEGNFDYIQRVFKNICVEDDNTEYIELISNTAAEKNLSLRTINLHLSRFLLDQNPLKSASEAIPLWIEELESIKVDVESKDESKDNESTDNESKDKTDEKNDDDDDDSDYVADSVSDISSPELKLRTSVMLSFEER